MLLRRLCVLLCHLHVSYYTVAIVYAIADTNTDFISLYTYSHPSSSLAFTDPNLAHVLYNALNDDGIIVAQMGQDDLTTDSAREVSPFGKPLASFIKGLTKEGFQSIKEYSESHGGFMSPWHFVTAFKSKTSKGKWYASQAEFDFAIRSRTLSTRTGQSSLAFFDGATMMTYQYPSRIKEEVFCRSQPSPPFCKLGHGFELGLYNETLHSQEPVYGDAKSTVGGNQTSSDLLAGGKSGDGTDNSGLPLPLVKSVVANLLHLPTYSTTWNVWNNVLSKYGYSHNNGSDPSASIELSLFQLMNYVQNDTDYTVDAQVGLSGHVDKRVVLSQLIAQAIEEQVHNPFADRNYMMHTLPHKEGLYGKIVEPRSEN
jgi:hypothetical protein